MKTHPFSQDQLQSICEKYPTPFHIYDEKAMVENAKNIKKAFASWCPDFKNYFAVKAAPNPILVDILHKEAGFGADCSSLHELLIAERVGIKGEDIMFTSNNTPAEWFKKAYDLGAIINFDDFSHIPYFEKHIGVLPSIGCIRFNPGAMKEGNEIIGNPIEAKFGMSPEEAKKAYKYFKEKGVKRFGLHTMVASNEINVSYFLETADIVFTFAQELESELGIQFEFINLGGGVGIPYKPEQDAVNFQAIADGIHAKRDAHKLSCKIVMEMGRYITGPYGYLITKVRNISESKFKTFVGVDASMSSLMRPGMYGSYHHISVLGKEKEEANKIYNVTGALCENNDQFAKDRKLPETEVGDIIVIHDAGAHGRAMCFNYNGHTRPGELLLKANKDVIQIRRAESIEDLDSTLSYPV